MSGPLVSIILPTYNRAETLPRAIESVIAQSVDTWELIVVDDGSTDPTREVLEGYRPRLGDRLRYLRRAHRGASAARNVGIDSATGRYATFLDSDDEYLPCKLERQLALFAMRPELGLVYGDYAFVDLRGRRHPSAFDEKLLLARAVSYAEVSPGLRVCDGSLFETLLRGYFIATIAGMVRRDVLGDAIRFDERLSYAEEWHFYLRVAATTRAGYVNEPLCLHHFTNGSVSRTDKARNCVAWCEALEAVLDTFPALPRRRRRIVTGSLSRAQKQVAFDCGERGAHLESARRFLRSFRFHPQPATLRNAVAALSRALFSKVTGPNASNAANDGAVIEVQGDTVR